MALIAFDCETDGLGRKDGGLEKIYVTAFSDSRMEDVVTFSCQQKNHVENAIQAAHRHMHILYSFNGTQFDTRMLARATTQKKEIAMAKEVALCHRDIMLQFATEKGYYTSLQSIATPTLGEKKTAQGGDVQQMAIQGRWDTINQYCAKDAHITAKVAQHGIEWGFLKRTSKGGKTSRWGLPAQKWVTAQEALATYDRKEHRDFHSSMTNPPQIHKMADWVVE